MSNEEYIASGILEIYAAGGLTQDEREEVRRHAAASPEIHAALEEACMAMETYAQMHAVTPRPELKSRILSDFFENPTASPQSDVADQEAKVIPISSPEREDAPPYKWMFAASIVLFLITGMLSLLYYNRWQQAEEQLAIVSSSEQLMAKNMETVSLRSQQLEESLTVLRDPDYTPVRLQGVEAHPQANMVVYWNPEQQQVYVDEIKLPVPPSGMQYQLWALDNGKPVDAGMISFRNGSAFLQKMKSVGSAQAFAVTLEPEGGSKNPTLEQLMVMGEVRTS